MTTGLRTRAARPLWWGAVVLCDAWLFVDVVTRYGEAQAQFELRSVAVTAAASLPPGVVASLKGSLGDVDTPAFDVVRAQLARIHQANPSTRFVYIMGRKGDHLWTIRAG